MQWPHWIGPLVVLSWLCVYLQARHICQFQLNRTTWTQDPHSIFSHRSIDPGNDHLPSLIMYTTNEWATCCSLYTCAFKACMKWWQLWSRVEPRLWLILTFASSCRAGIDKPAPLLLCCNLWAKYPSGPLSSCHGNQVVLEATTQHCTAQDKLGLVRMLHTHTSHFGLSEERALLVVETVHLLLAPQLHRWERETFGQKQQEREGVRSFCLRLVTIHCASHSTMSIKQNTSHQCPQSTGIPTTLWGALVCSDTAWSIPSCAAVSASISVEGPLSAVGAPLCELGDDGTEGGSE